MYLEQAKQLIQQLNPKLERLFVGCTEVEIAEMESHLQVSIPAAFREFLLWFGKSGGNLMAGSCFYYHHIIGKAHPEADEKWQGYTLKDEAIELLDENGLDGKQLLEHTLVFMEHQGYMFEFIPTNQGDNPPVFYYQEGEEGDKNKIQPWADSFSDYVEHLMQTQGKPRDSLFIHDAADMENPFSYDDHIKHLSFNGSFKSQDGLLPVRIYDFINLESLDLRYFNLIQIDEELIVFQKLLTLNLNQNRLTQLPSALFSFQHLETLYLSGNQLINIPQAFEKLTSLRKLDLSGNPLSSFQVEAFRNALPQIEVVF